MKCLLLTVCVLLGAGSIAPAAAQIPSPPPSLFALPPALGPSLDALSAQPAGPAPTPRHTGVRALLKDLVDDVKHLPAKENLLLTVAGGGAALAVHPLDDNVQRELVNNDTASTIFKPGAVIGQFGTLFGTATATYLTGRLSDKPKISHLGMDLIQALAISQGLTQGVKFATRRERPDGSAHNSFPSGHSSGTFAFATALERHLGWRGAVPAYAIASYVAASRLPANKHWFSDVVFGSALGIVAGRTVTRHGRDYPITIAAVPGGVAVMYSRRQP